ncbi:GMC family oxidoreductase [Rhodococcus wratislaviensis]|uniref:GMC family oxidoreductase n=1 Tax=Rhodococcus wratislaviensis TaxID=44752 RepID=UPI0036627A0D
MDTYDYIVVGGGTAGCIIAARLTEDPEVRVLLLEAGGSERRPEIENPGAWPSLAGSELDWNYATVPQKALGRTVPATRGKVLGGSGSINVMAHLRGHRVDYDSWAAEGAEGWDYDSVLPYFMRSEDVPDGDPRFRGRGGPLAPRPIDSPHPLSLAHVEAARQAQHAVAADLNSGELLGAACHELLISGNRRQSTASAYLRPARGRTNLTVRTGAICRRLVIVGDRCRGVEYTWDGHSIRSAAAGDVVLCAGAVDSVRLLLHSGVGPVRDLESVGVQPVIESPEVGLNLQDHILLAGVRMRADRQLPPPSGNYAESTLFAKTNPSQTRPELQIVQIQVDYHTPWQRPAENSYTFGIGHMRPRSRGSIRMASSDPEAPLLIDPKYLSDPYGIEQLIAGIEVVNTLAETSAFDAWGGTSDASALLRLDRPELEKAIHDSVSSFFHLSGTCRMGTDATAVVDPHLRVRGVDGLRVADASVMPSIVSCNTNAATVMIGEKAADLLCGRPAG